MKSLETIDIKKFLPHRAPMLMVDRILYIDSDSVIADFKITSECIFVSNNSLKEVGLLENIAQSCSAIVGQSYFSNQKENTEHKRVLGFISAIKKVEIHQLPNVGDVIITKASLVSRFDTGSISMCAMECTTEIDNQLLASCTLNLLIQKEE